MKTVGIMGGMGPMATARFYQMLIELTDAHCDQEHIHVMIDSVPELPDRTAHIMGKGRSPLQGMRLSLKRLADMGAEVVAIPCNTAHYYFESLEADDKIQLIHMVNETAQWIQKQSKIGKVGLLATSGTYYSELYQKAFSACDKPLVLPRLEQQKELMRAIYAFKEGRRLEAEWIVNGVVKELTALKVDAWILGCTELPLIFSKQYGKIALIDSSWILARKTIQISGAKLSETDDFYKRMAVGPIS